TPPAPPPAPAPQRRDTQKVTQKIVPLTDARVAQVKPMVTQPGSVPMPAAAPLPVVDTAHTAARKLQDAVDETQLAEEKRLDLGKKIEGASKTFTLHENGFLEINFGRSVHVKRGTVSSYSGNLKFVAESGLLG